MQARKKLELFAASAGLPLLGALSEPMDFKALNYSLFVALYFFKMAQEEKQYRDQIADGHQALTPIMEKKREHDRLMRIKEEEARKGRGFVALSCEFFILFLASSAAVSILSSLSGSASADGAGHFALHLNCPTIALTIVAWLTVLRFFELSLAAAFITAGLTGLSNFSPAPALEGSFPWLDLPAAIIENFLSSGATLGLALLFLHGHFAHHRNALKIGNYQYLLAVVLVGGMNRLGLLLFGQ